MLQRKTDEWNAEKDVARSKKRKSSQGATANVIPYSKEESQYKLIIAVFVEAGNILNSIVTNEDFRELLQTLDPRYSVPGKVAISHEIDMLYLEMKARVQSHMAKAKRVSFCIDVWTKRGMTSSYLVVTGHFFCHGNDNTSGIHAATLAVRCM